MGPVPRSTRDVANVYTYLTRSKHGVLFPGERTSNKDDKTSGNNVGDEAASTFYQTESEYYAFQKRLLALEVRVMRALSFDTHASLPHALAITYLQTLDFLDRDRREVTLRTVQHLNTGLLSPQLLYLTHQPHALATAAIYCAARDLSAKMPECPWWEVFDVDREELGFLVVALRSVEGILRGARGNDDDAGWLAEGGGIVTRAKVHGELARRDGGRPADDEDEVMRLMDSR